MSTVTIYKQRNLLRIRNVKGELADLLKRTLTYERRKQLMTKKERDAAQGRTMEISVVRCFDTLTVDKEPQLRTNAGFLQRITDVLKQNGYTPNIKDLEPERRASVFVPNWDNAEGFDWRHRQRETLECLLAHQRGQVWWATGAGKSWLMVPLCLVLPRARIVICTKHLSVLNEHYTRLSKHLPDVGLVNGSSKQMGCRVTCVSSGSLQHIDPMTTDIFLADEHHELATDVMFEKFARFEYSRMFGLSANFNDRFDGADFELEGIFGPLITKLTYEEGVKNDMIVPIQVHWREVMMRNNPAAGMDGVFRKKFGIWRNNHRNAMIAEDARKHPKDQVLITVETLEHACYLKKHLPEFTLCYAPNDMHKESLDDYKLRGLIPQEMEPITATELFENKRAFEAGTLRKVIATTVWNRGVNFHHLQVLIRADASSSAIADTQIPGRLSRLNDGKQYGLLIDYMDEFDASFKRKSLQRLADYKKKGWTQLKHGKQKNGATDDEAA
jgi:superfamily II DNA or RNA helicase